MKLKERWKYAKMSIISGGVSFVNMKALQPEELLSGKNILLYFPKQDPFCEILKDAISRKGAKITNNRDKTDTFINVINLDTEFQSLIESDSKITKFLFFINQEEKDIMITKKIPGSIVNIIELNSIVNPENKEIVLNGIKSFTRGLAIALANDRIKVNSIVCDSLSKFQKGISDLTVFLSSDCSNDILGQIIRIGVDK
jgi:hypothetical protein